MNRTQFKYQNGGLRSPKPAGMINDIRDASKMGLGALFRQLGAKKGNALWHNMLNTRNQRFDVRKFMGQGRR